MAYFIASIPYIIVLVLMIFHSIIGYWNGTKKTVYYIIVDIIITTVIIFALSFVTVQKFYTTENLLVLLERIFSVPESVKKYFTLPELNESLYVFGDIIVRVLLFIGIVTLTKWIFKFGIFKPIYPKIVNGTKKTKKDRRKGALIGSFKGLVLGVIFIIPIWFMDGGPNIDLDFPFEIKTIQQDEHYTTKYDLINYEITY